MAKDNFKIERLGKEVAELARKIKRQKWMCVYLLWGKL
jgi:hypothetical protein